MPDFQVNTVTWANGAGFIRKGAVVARLTAKPPVGFEFDSLYAEETNSTKVLAGVTIPLTAGEIVAVDAWLDAQNIADYQRVLGVDADGLFLGECAPAEAFRIVKTAPPNGDHWVYDFTASDAAWADVWAYIHGVGAGGEYLGNVALADCAEVATSAPPSSMPYWRWSAGAWIDQTPLDVLKQQRVTEAWQKCEWLLENEAVATLAINGINYEFGVDRETRENIIGINAAISVGVAIDNPRPYFPKGALTPIMLTHADFALIGGALLAVKDAYMVAYLTHKATISAMTDVAGVLAYDLNTGWPA
ncbi:MAG: hypothetical protein ACK4TP_11215 [Hyphomicrobium sp.]